MLPAEVLRSLLENADDPLHLERPADFDLQKSARRFAALTGAMEDRFGPACDSGLYQDASIYGEVEISEEITGTGRPLWVQMSNFGGFVTAGTGPWTEPGPTEGMTDQFVEWLDATCVAADCVFVPLDLLLEPYDGPSLLEEAYADEVLSALATDEDGDDGEQTLPVVWVDRYFNLV
ncbi:hypothetical protein N7925_26525 [Streptomyces sp. CA-278952]|uniref:hypothetical protein n=1 Tax=unclassified Streptomyces TaxID=2593676 RepID=UPI0022426036|nr:MULTISPECIES: hypothetical protein [unclassified Streptomyces]UZI31571.1 hypothetical protein OH133_27720 [Streptomyces sp. VB1]WDG31619.1 hypothetical protein N7925_26525 [Streptomyces sp. CA-278952]